MRGGVVGVWMLAAGCSLGPVRTSDPFVVSERPERVPEYRGPGEWRPAARTRAPAAHVSLIRSGIRTAGDATVSSSGRYVLFTQGQNVCASDTSTGVMTTDTDVEDSGDTGFVGGWGGPDGPEVAGSSADDGVLVIEDGELHRLDLSTGTFSQPGLRDLVDAAALADGTAVGVRADGSVRFEDGAVVPTPANLTSGWDLAVDGASVLLATVDGVVRVDRAGARVVSEGAWFVAADPVSRTWVRGSELGLAAPGWTWRAPGVIRRVVDGGDTGTFLVRVDDGGDQRIHVLDAPTGEELGVLEVRDDLVGFDAADRGGVLLQVRREEAVTWHLERGL